MLTRRQGLKRQLTTNIFNRSGLISGSIGGELTLKEDLSYPIATYQDLKRDAMQSLLNALSTLEKEDGAGIQISNWSNRPFMEEDGQCGCHSQKTRSKQSDQEYFGSRLCQPASHSLY